MKFTLAALVVAAVSAAGPGQADAQILRGYTTVGVNADVNEHRFTSFGGGVLVDVAAAWVSAGGEAELLTSNGYFAGRGGPVAQLNAIHTPRVRVFGSGGFAWGEEAGPMIGAGIEWWSRGFVGLRVRVSDYLARLEGFDRAAFGHAPAFCRDFLHNGASRIAHQPSLRFGVAWR